ncbi:hypothetical protein GL270_21145 [Aeromonas veronii]|uniref:hypothetical protein n=1 Tax=Aeromonas veronii TaxID=654 RepID=UPI001C5BB4E3|nr:hypothetical protein [Aeromonas veronii]MBW3783708.1 hypothetical protein [Aeromonas veronii]
MWGMIAMAGVSLASSMMSSNSAAKQAQYQAQLQYQSQMAQLGVEGSRINAAYQEQLLQNQWNQKAWDQGLYNQQLTMDNYYQNLALQRELMGNQYQQQQYMYDRQAQYDYLAQQDRQFQMQQLYANQGLAQKERDQAMLELQRAQQIAQQEAQYSKDRQRYLDGMAYDERGYAIDQFNWAKQLADMERQFDIKQFQQASSDKKADAAFDRSELFKAQQQLLQQRADEIAEIKRVQGILGDERDFDIDTLRQNQALAMEERAIDQQLRNLYLTQAQSGTQRVQDLLTNMGTPAEVRRFGDADVAQRQAILASKYTELADRAIDRVSSQNEVRLIASGMDLSTAADMSRAAVAQQAAASYIEAETRSYNEALAQVQGLNELNAGNERATFERRGNLINETMQAFLQPLQYLTQAPQVRSAIYDKQLTSAGQYMSPQTNAAFYQPGTSTVYDRAIQSAMANAPVQIGSGYSGYDTRSANNYQSPLNVGSAIYNGQVGSGAAQQLGIPGLNASYMGAPVYNMPQINVNNAYSQAFAGMSNVYGGMSNGYANNNQAYLNAAAGAGQAAGSALADLGSTAGSWLDSYLKKNGGGWNGSSSVPAYNYAMMPSSGQIGRR